MHIRLLLALLMVTVVAASEERHLVQRAVRDYYDAPCDSSTPILVVGTFKAGFGNILDWWMLSLYALFSDYMDKGVRRVLVFERGGMWVEIDFVQDVIRPSACQQLFDTDRHQFKDAERAEHYRHGAVFRSMVRTNKFRHVPLRTVLTALYNHFLWPKFDGRRFGVLELSTRRGHVGIHYRRGDACTTAKINTGRPPCQPFGDYLKHVPAKAASIFVATDDPSFSGNEDKRIVVYPMERDKYTPKGTLKIEAFADKSRAKEFMQDYLLDVADLATSAHLIGQCYSSMMNAALFLGVDNKNYTCVDQGYPCLRGGCPTPHAFRRDRCPWMLEAFDPGTKFTLYEPLYKSLWEDFKKGGDLCDASLRVSGTL